MVATVFDWYVLHDLNKKRDLRKGGLSMVNKIVSALLEEVRNLDLLFLHVAGDRVGLIKLRRNRSFLCFSRGLLRYNDLFRTRNAAGVLQSSLEWSILRFLRSAQAGRDDGDGRLIRLGVVIHGTEDDIGLFSCQILYILSSIAGVDQSDVTGDIDDDMRSALDRSVKQRRCDRFLDSLKSLGG